LVIFRRFATKVLVAPDAEQRGAPAQLCRHVTT
jgi:hypothetical protein